MTDWFLYLTKREWAEAWIHGGDIPIAPATKYLAAETGGTQTPDELMQYRVQGLDPAVYNALNEAGFGGGEGGMIFNGVNVILPDGNQVSADGWATAHPDETIILSFSRICENRLAQLLSDEKGIAKEAIVRIKNPDHLLRHISQELGIEGSCEHFSYTKGVNRSHSLKGWNDRHMAEIRLLWRMSPAETKWVTLPPGMAELVDEKEIPDEDPRALELDFESYDRAFERRLARREPARTPRAMPRTILEGVEFRGVTFDLRPPPLGANRAEKRRTASKLRKKEKKRRRWVGPSGR